MTKTEKMQWFAAVVLVVGGILLLCAPSTAQMKTAVPTRFTVVDEGTEGKPDVVLVPGLTSRAKYGRAKPSGWRRITVCTSCR
jgi:hypothetical protein